MRDGSRLFLFLSDNGIKLQNYIITPHWVAIHFYERHYLFSHLSRYFSDGMEHTLVLQPNTYIYLCIDLYNHKLQADLLETARDP